MDKRTVTYGDVFLTEEGLARNEDGHVFSGTPRHSRRRALQGVGVNDFPFAIMECNDRKIIRWKPHAMWSNMLSRVFSEAVHNGSPCYIGATVDESWLIFSGFLRWLLPQPLINADYDLDKDILGNGKRYGPDTCAIVPRGLNVFITDGGTKGGGVHIGARLHKGTGEFYAYIGGARKRKYLGVFPSAEEANAAWLCEKLKQASEFRDQLDQIDERLYPRVVQKIHLINNKEKCEE